MHSRIPSPTPWVQQYQNLYNVDEQTICTNRCWIHNGSIYWVLPPVVDEKLAQGYPAASTAAFAAESIRGALDAWHEALVTNVTTNNRIQKASRKFHEAIAERTHIMFGPHDDEVLHGDVLVGGIYDPTLYLWICFTRQRWWFHGVLLTLWRSDPI